MKIEDLFDRSNIIDLNFFNFRNAITACYYADTDLRIIKVNDNFRSFFPILGNVSNAWFPDVLEQLGVGTEQIRSFSDELAEHGHVLITDFTCRTASSHPADANVKSAEANSGGGHLRGANPGLTS